MATPLALIVDDRPADQLAVAGIVREEGCQVLFAENCSAALAAFRPDVNVVVCRGVVDGVSGLDFLRQWQRRQGETLFLFLLKRDEHSAARQLIKLGAAGCILEPVDFDELRALLRRCLEWHHKTEREKWLRARLDERLGFDALVGVSKLLQIAVVQARLAAESAGGVLISGEPGTGKTLIAEMIHQNSRRAAGPFVPFQVWGSSVRLVEQEIFGTSNGGRPHTAGRTSVLERAAGGTLFADDIADLAAVTQSRLLRALERRLPGGAIASGMSVPDVRIIAATTRRLDALVSEGRFSAGLYRRIGENQVFLPPLRERREDIPLLTDHFLREASARGGRAVPAMEAELSRFLQRFDWPGNVRQLKNCVESMLVFSKAETLTLDDLPARIDDPSHDGTAMYFPAGMTLGELERTAVEKALAASVGNRTRAAERLGISVRTLQRKLKTWSMEGIDETGVPRS
jgi:two-component system, NtrC family, response regulator HydG